MHHYLHRTIGLTAAIFIVVTPLACGNDKAQTQTTVATLSPERWRLPSSLTWCGEPVPLDVPEVRERAERELLVNLQSPGQMLLYLKRSARYFPLFERLAREAGIPADVKYLSVAESALFMARSSKDAVGLWQFIPATAREMGLVVTEEVDERRHPEKSTRAAFAYLKQGYGINGSWTNAAAGYNMGHASFAENLSYQRASSFYDLYLNEETSRYVLRIAVIKYIMENADALGLRLAPEDRYAPDSTRPVVVSGAVPDLAAWALAQGTTYKDVKLLNPWILKRTLPAPAKGTTWTVAVPAVRN